MGGLYAIVDPARAGSRDPFWVATEVLEGGCAKMQLRMKDASDHDRLALGRRVRAACRHFGVPFVINDRADLACLLDADGLHLGQDDLPIAEARRIVGAMEIGRSTHSLDQAERALVEGADVLALGPIFPTRSKMNPDPVVGLETLRQVCRLPAPVVAIGGVQVDNAAEVHAAGARWGAVIGALSHPDGPRKMAAALHTALGASR